MPTVLSDSDVEFICEGLRQGCAYLMKTKLGKDLWLVPNGGGSLEPNLWLEDLACVSTADSAEVLYAKAQARAAFQQPPPKEKPKPKKLWGY